MVVTNARGQAELFGAACPTRLRCEEAFERFVRQDWRPLLAERNGR
jgi:hypothetical protein